MFTKTLPKNAQGVLALLGKTRVLGPKAYLAGGSALSLQLCHRISVDLDFFTAAEFEPTELARSITRFFEFEVENTGAGTLLGRINGVRFSCFLYEYPVLFPLLDLDGIHIADKLDIAAMKIAAVSARGTKKDFIDLYFLCRDGLGLKKMLTLYDKKYGKLAANYMHIMKSLTYFVDAEVDEMPKMVKHAAWKDIKTHIELEVAKMSKMR